MSKKRILCVGEFSQFHTGFAGYIKELLKGLHATNKYELAELGVYLPDGHPAELDVPWKVYANEPHPQSPDYIKQAFASNSFNVFGHWRFTEVLLDFKPDIVINISDPWMQHFINGNPLRNNFKYLHMPTVDSEPQKVDWIQDYMKCDGILTYSYYGKRTLALQSSSKINVLGVASPGSNPEWFFPKNKTELRQKYCPAYTDKYIVQTVMRNQPRKLFTQLFKAFAKYLHKCMLAGRKDIADRTVLHIHTNPNDVGWSIADEIVNHRLSHKVIVTYICDGCKHVNVKPCQSDGTVCPKCHGSSFRASNSMQGVSREVLGDLMAMADLYVQYSVAGGWEMPISDAKMCGVAVATTDYAAMSEQAHAPGGIPVRVGNWMQEPLNQTYAIRALPDNDHLADIFFQSFVTQQLDIAKIGQEGRELAMKEYTWSTVTEVWQTAIDKLECLPRQQTWYSEPKFMIPHQPPANLNPYQLLHFVTNNIYKQPERLNKPWGNERLIRLLTGRELVVDQAGRSIVQTYTAENLLKEAVAEAQNFNQVETLRLRKLYEFNTDNTTLVGIS